MKLKYLLAACTAFFLVSCSNDDELPQLLQHGDIVGLNIKDAKYIYTSGTNTRSSAAQYRQIKKDGRDMELSWIDDKGDTVRISGNPKIWNINVTDNYTGSSLYKIHTQDVTNLRLEMYARASVPPAQFVVNNKGVCFYDYRYIRPSYGTQQFIISNFIPQTEYGNAFVSHDNEDLYLTAVSGEYDSYKLVVSKLSEKQEL